MTPHLGKSIVIDSDAVIGPLFYYLTEGGGSRTSTEAPRARLIFFKSPNFFCVTLQQLLSYFTIYFQPSPDPQEQLVSWSGP